MGFKEPETRQEAEERLTRVKDDIKAITRQLDDETRAEWFLKNGKSRQDYNEWRTSANNAKATKQKEEANLLRWIRQDRDMRRSALVERIVGDPDSPEALLRGLYHVVRSATMEKRLCLDRDEAVIFAKVRDFLAEAAFAEVEENGNGAAPNEYRIVGVDADEILGRLKRRSSVWAILRGATRDD